MGQDCTEQPASLGSAVGQPTWKVGPPLREQAFGQGSEDLPVSFSLPDMVLSSAFAAGTRVMSATEVQGGKVCYARCESVWKNVAQ